MLGELLSPCVEAICTWLAIAAAEASTTSLGATGARTCKPSLAEGTPEMPEGEGSDGAEGAGRGIVDEDGVAIGPPSGKGDPVVVGKARVKGED